MRVARAFAIVHTCMYDAWAAYTSRAIGTQLGGALRRPQRERTLENKTISIAAYIALLDLIPTERAAVFDPLLLSLGLDPLDANGDGTGPADVGTDRL